MKINKTIVAVVVLLGATVVGRGEVLVSKFGYDPEDSTRFIQAALDSGADKVVFDRQKGPWVTNPVFARSNTEIVFEEGVELLAKRGEFMLVRGNSLFSLECVTNVTVRGLGKGAVMRMWKKDYQQEPYKHSEWRHALNIMSAKDIRVENMSFVASGGDGIYLGVKVSGCANTDVTIRNCICDDNHRQGISVISAENLLIENVIMKNTDGTAPMAGIDFEPNSYNEKLVNCVMRNCITENNRGAGYDMYFGQLDSRTAPLSITLENCKSIGDKRCCIPLTFNPERHNNGLPTGGFLKVRNCHFKDCKSAAITLQNKPLGVMDVSVEDTLIENCPAESPDAANVNLLTKALDYPSTDGISFRNVTIRRGEGGDWIHATKRPWAEKSEVAVCGEVKLESASGSKTVVLDRDWLNKRFPHTGQKLVLTTVQFDPAKVSVVDSRPGLRIKMSPLKLRFGCDAMIYAAKPGPVTFAAKVYKVNKKALKDVPFTVYEPTGKRVIAKMNAPVDSVKDFTFKAPKAGFYRIMCDVTPHALVFTESTAPIGFMPPVKTKFDIFTSSGDVWFYHQGGVDSTIFCGGGIQEYATFRLFDPSGEEVGEWPDIGDWGFRRIAPNDKDGLWCVRLSRPSKGKAWEDTFLNITGGPAVFFLSCEKYWK